MMRIKFLLFSTVLIVCAGAVFAQKYQPAGDAWITKWWGMDLVTNTGGFNASAAHDWLSEGTGGKITDASVTTSNGLKILKEIKSVNLKNNGGELKWDIVTINPNDGNNMSTSHGLADQSNIEWYGIIVIKSPNNRKTKIHPAHDDYGHIWLNGEKVYNNPDWTTGATIVTRPTEITLKKGDKVIFIDVVGSLFEGLFSRKPRERSQEVITQLSKRFSVVFLQTGLLNTKLLKSWLKEHKFVDLPILLWQKGLIFDETIKKGLKIKAIIGNKYVIESAKEYKPRLFSFEEAEDAEIVNEWGKIGEFLLKKKKSSYIDRTDNKNK